MVINQIQPGGANVFTARSGDSLSAVGTYARTANTSMAVSIYTDLKSAQPTSGTLVSTKNVSFKNAGYYTIPLDKTVPLTVGKKFAVVIKYTTPTSNYPIPTEFPIKGYSSKATANSGESFSDADGLGVWSDAGVVSKSNVCIKAYTSGVVSTLSSIVITKPATKLIYHVGNSLDVSGLEITGMYSDGSKKIESITAANITGFDSSKSLAKQTLTINVAGKTATYNIQIKDLIAAGTCYYQTHIQNVGWQSTKKNGVLSGTEKQSLRLEGIQIMANVPGYNLGVEYSTHIQDVGWQEKRANGKMSGTSGRGLRLEGIKINLTGADADKFDIFYRTHVQNVGWQNWVKNGEISGTSGKSYRLEGIKIIILPKGETPE